MITEPCRRDGLLCSRRAEGYNTRTGHHSQMMEIRARGMSSPHPGGTTFEPEKGALCRLFSCGDGLGLCWVTQAPIAGERRTKESRPSLGLTRSPYVRLYASLLQRRRRDSVSLPCEESAALVSAWVDGAVRKDMGRSSQPFHPSGNTKWPPLQ